MAVEGNCGRLGNELPARLSASSSATGAGEIRPELDVAQFAFEINALLVAANLAFPLFGDPGVLERARLGVVERLRAATPDEQRATEPFSV